MSYGADHAEVCRRLRRLSTSRHFRQGGWVGLAMLAVSVIGGYAQSRANKKNAQRLSDASRESTAMQVQASREATEAQLAGIRASEAQFRALQEQARPAVDYLRSIVALDPSRLTEAQQRTLDEAGRATTNKIRSSRGGASGRYVAAAIRDAEAGMRAQLLDENTNRSDRAASQLAAPYFNAGSQIASGQARAGQVQGQGIQHAGQLKGQGIYDIASIDAERRANNAKIVSDTLGNMVGSYAAGSRTTTATPATTAGSDQLLGPTNVDTGEYDYNDTNDSMSAIGSIISKETAKEERDSRYGSGNEFHYGE